MPTLSAHAQTVEPLIREVTQACDSVAGCQRRDSFICARIASREVVPEADTKSDFFAMANVL